ncbi:MAG: hypothetical protein J7578_11225 [Chitinophagaceae bacterium]|nr:hypothetical protein [Chitinophagaceae bacterium]
MWKKIVKYTGWSIAIIISLLGTIYLIAWKSPAYYTLVQSPNAKDSIVPFRDYSAYANHTRPFIVEGENYIIMGASHTRDPRHPDLRLIHQKWERLNPTVALVESRLGFLIPYLMDPVKNLGEGGYVKKLADKDGVPVYTWDLQKEALAKALEGSFTREQIALAQILNPYFSDLRFGKPASPGNFIQPFLSRAAYVGQEARFRTVADVDLTWKKYFPQGPDWREVSDEKELPGYLSAMMAASNDLRNRQLVGVVKELTAKNERVFLLCGSSHAFCVAPAFK